MDAGMGAVVDVPLVLAADGVAASIRSVRDETMDAEVDESCSSGSSARLRKAIATAEVVTSSSSGPPLLSPHDEQFVAEATREAKAAAVTSSSWLREAVLGADMLLAAVAERLPRASDVPATTELDDPVPSMTAIVAAANSVDTGAAVAFSTETYRKSGVGWTRK